MVATLIAGERTLSGAAVEERALRAVSALDRIGIAAGAAVALMLRNDIAALEAMLALRRGGCYAVPINWHFKAEEAGYILRDSGAQALIIHADLLPQIAGAIPAGVAVIAVEPGAALRAAFALDPAQCRAPPGLPEWESFIAGAAPHAGPPRPPVQHMAYSSGTTGRPKGIRRAPLAPEHVAASAEVMRLGLGVEPGLRTALAAPLYHSAPYVHGLNSLVQGALILVAPRFDAASLLADIERHRLTHLYLVPTMYVRLLQLPEAVRRRHDLSSIACVASTGSPCPPEIKRAMIEWWGPVITESYASSETSLITLATSADALARPGTAGKPLPGAEIRILDEDGREVPPGTVGTIYCRQTALPDFTYVNNDAARRAMDRDGLAALGDLGYVDRDGYLFVCDRRSDMVISGGVNIYPAEIEAVLLTLPGVADCAVFGIPDAEFGEALAAHIKPQPGASLDAEAVRGFVRARLASYKVPRIVEFAPSLPREDSGKIFKRRLREPYWQGTGRRI
ncbi:MAG: AMP-binding protein [Stellaceae bacterium]